MKKFKFFLRIFISPLMFVFIPFVFLKSIFNFAIEKKIKFMGFDEISSFNNYFYKIQKLNLDIYNKHKKSPLLGFGQYHMSRLFYIPSISHNFFIHFGPAFTTILFSFLNIFICLIFYNISNSEWLILLIFLGFFSGINYSSSFTSQNYNFVAWLFFPIIIFSIIQSKIYLLIISIICLFFSSFGVGLYLGLFTTFYVIFIDFSYYYLVFLFIFLTLIFIYPLIRSGLIKKWLIETFLFIGISKKNKYSRSHQRLSRFNIYYTMLFSIPIILNFLIENDYVFLINFSFIIFIINQFFFRFMDRENPIYAFLICNLIFTILNPKMINLLPFILIANPFVDSLNISKIDKKFPFFKLRVFQPFKNYKLLNKIKKFTEKVPKNNTILFAYNNPKNNYDKIFDGYRNIVETIYFHFQIRKIRSFPDWYAIWEETNKNKIVWGRSLQKIIENLKKLNTKYVVYYSEKNQIKDQSIKKKFKILSKFSIEKNHKNSTPLWINNNKILNFYLLEKK